MKLEAQEKMRSDRVVKVEPDPCWDHHSAKHEPLLVNMSWEIIAIHITDQYPEVAQEMANNQDFEDMTN